ncbi:hypothetical protein ASE16_04805 [Leifsonia sp. Root227]|nr:hypothetical protein ASE16_04805 [Leifsonia sp. Root227]
MVTAIGVVVAILQAKEARADRIAAEGARDAAKQHEKSALDAATQSASAATRSASALEEANDIARKSLPKDPWTLVQQTKNKYELRNTGEETLWAVSITEPGDSNDITLFQEQPVDQLHPGESLYFDYSKTFASPASTTLLVTWGYPDSSEQRVWRRTLS